MNNKFLPKAFLQALMLMKMIVFYITDYQNSFKFYASIKSYGFQTDQSDEYFYFLGIFSDQISATFSGLNKADT